jgi:argininosuccinate synthase
LRGLPQKARATGASKHYTLDLVEEFATDFIYPMIRANAIYEGQYYFGTSIARPLIAKAQVAIAKKEKADTVAHGATGKGNDQCRFELTYMALDPRLADHRPVEARRTFREEFPGRAEMIEYCAKNKIPVEASLKKPYSMDRNLLHISYEAGILEDPWFDPTTKANKGMFKLSVSPEDAPEQGGVRRARIREGQLRGRERQEAVAGRRAEDPQPAGRQARHRPRRPRGEPVRRHEVTRRLRDARRHDPACRRTGRWSPSRWTARSCTCATALIPKYAELVYYGFWFAPEREALQALVDESQQPRHRHRPAQALQGQHHHVRPEVEVFALRHEHRVDGRREELVQPDRRDRLYPPEWVAASAPAISPRAVRGSEEIRWRRRRRRPHRRLRQRVNRRPAVGASSYELAVSGAATPPSP